IPVLSRRFQCKRAWKTTTKRTGNGLMRGPGKRRTFGCASSLPTNARGLPRIFPPCSGTMLPLFSPMPHSCRTAHRRTASRLREPSGHESPEPRRADFSDSAFAAGPAPVFADGRARARRLTPFADDNQWIGWQTPHPAFGPPHPIRWGEGWGEGGLGDFTVFDWELGSSTKPFH